LLSEPAIDSDNESAALRVKNELATKLMAAADAYKDYARALHRARHSLPVRNRDARARMVVQTISRRFQVLFDQPMYGQTAIIASVILRRQIDLRTVRFWCTPYPAVKPQKIGP
jgi:hypothetical protein